MTIYLGHSLLDISPNARDGVDDGLQRSLAVLDPGLGVKAVRMRNPSPALSRTILWTCHNRAAVVELKDWLLERKGRAVPFWLPTRRRDFVLDQAVGPSDAGISIKSLGYADLVFPVPARRHLAFLSGSTWILRSVTAATKAGGMETLTLSSPTGQALPVDALVCQLLLCRLASDENEISHLTESVAEARIPILETPQEVP